MTDDKFKKALNEALSGEYDLMLTENSLPEHQFSENFEKKMNKLIKRRREPYFHFINTAEKRARV